MTTHTPHVDVLVVGAGPVGLTVALELHRLGVDFWVVDKRPGPHNDARSTLIQPRSLELYRYHHPRVHTLLRERSLPFRGVTFTCGDDLIGRRQYEGFYSDRPLDTPCGPGISLSQAETERTLLEGLSVGVSSPVRWDTTFMGARETSEGVLVTTSAGTVHCHYLVGADGCHSRVRRAAGIAFEGEVCPRKYYTCFAELSFAPQLAEKIPVSDAWLPWPSSNNLESGGMLLCSFLPSPPHSHTDCRCAQVVFGGIREGGVQIETQVTPGGSSETFSREQLERFLREYLFGGLESAGEWLKVNCLERAKSFTLRHMCAQKYLSAGGRILLAGDACHVQTPHGAQNMNCGIQDAFNLAWKVAASLTKWHTTRKSQPGVSVELLRSYEEERLPVGKSMVAYFRKNHLRIVDADAPSIRAAQQQIRRDWKNPQKTGLTSRVRDRGNLGVRYHRGCLMTPQKQYSRVVGCRAPNLELAAFEGVPPTEFCGSAPTVDVALPLCPEAVASLSGVSLQGEGKHTVIDRTGRAGAAGVSQEAPRPTPVVGLLVAIRTADFVLSGIASLSDAGECRRVVDFYRQVNDTPSLNNMYGSKESGSAIGEMQLSRL